MTRRAVLAVLPAIALALGLVAVSPTPAQAAVNLCRGSGSYGDVIYSIKPAGSSITRYIKAKACVEWDTNSHRTRTRITCQTGTSDASGFCDIRAEILHSKLDIYSSPSVFSHTAEDTYFGSPAGYYGSVVWQGHDHATGVVCQLIQQNNNSGIRVRFGFDGVLRSMPNYSSLRGEVC